MSSFKRCDCNLIILLSVVVKWPYYIGRFIHFKSIRFFKGFSIICILFLCVFLRVSNYSYREAISNLTS